MKRRIGMAWVPVALALVFALPGTTAAVSGYSMTKVDQHCYGAQGQDVYLRVRIVANGSTPANKLSIKSTSQYFSGGKWHASFHWHANTTTFTPNGQSHDLDFSYTHEGTNQHDWRIVSKLAAWNGHSRLASKTLKSLAC